MTDQCIIDHLRTDGLLTVALTMTGEAVGDARDGSSIEERIAVGCVMRNRLESGRTKQFGATWSGVCLQPWQFSCWNANDPNRKRLLAAAAANIGGDLAGVGVYRLPETVYLAGGIIQGVLLDITRGSTHYFNPRVVPAPVWAYTDKSKKTLLTPTAIVGSHQFYRGIA